MPTEDLDDEDYDFDVIATKGWESPPPVGSTLLIVPSDRDQGTRTIRHLYTVLSVSETGDREWPIDLEIERRAISRPRTWYELVREVQIRGLAPLTGELDEDWTGARIVHVATISMIFEMLGEA